MANDQFSRIMRFAQRTGDRLIVTDPEGREPVVIMSLDEYEALVEGALGPGDFRAGDFEEGADFDEDDEYGEAPTLEIVESMAEEIPVIPVPESVAPAVQERPRPSAAQPIPRAEETKIPQKRDESSEEQFYLEPL